VAEYCISGAGSSHFELLFAYASLMCFKKQECCVLKMKSSMAAKYERAIQCLYIYAVRTITCIAKNYKFCHMKIPTTLPVSLKAKSTPLGRWDFDHKTLCFRLKLKKKKKKKV